VDSMADRWLKYMGVQSNSATDDVDQGLMIQDSDPQHWDPGRTFPQKVYILHLHF
jgi:hypothetical protein